MLADAHNRLARTGQFVDANRNYYFEIGGPKFTLPLRSIEAIRTRAEVEVAWLNQTFGILLAEPEVEKPGAGRFTEEVATDIVKLILAGRALRDAVSDIGQIDTGHE